MKTPKKTKTPKASSVLENIHSSLFELKDSEKILGGNSTPVADSSSCEPWSGNIPGHKFYQEDLDKDGKIVAWGDNYDIHDGEFEKL